MNEHIKSFDDFKIACGVDTLYFYVQTNSNYEKLYDDIEKSLNDKITYFTLENIKALD